MPFRDIPQRNGNPVGAAPTGCVLTKEYAKSAHSTTGHGPGGTSKRGAAAPLCLVGSRRGDLQGEREIEIPLPLNGAFLFGFPFEAQRSGFKWERRSSGMSELSPPRRKRGIWSLRRRILPFCYKSPRAVDFKKTFCYDNARGKGCCTSLISNNCKSSQKQRTLTQKGLLRSTVPSGKAPFVIPRSASDVGIRKKRIAAPVCQLARNDKGAETGERRKPQT